MAKPKKPAAPPRLPEHGTRAVADLTPDPRNSRTHTPDQVRLIAASIRKFGFTMPVLIDASNVIIAGHARWQAAQELGLDTVPVLIADYLSDDERRAYVIADNQLALRAGWDEEMLAAEVRELETAGFNLSILGFEEKALQDLLKAAEDYNEDPAGHGTDAGNYVEQYAVIVTCRDEAHQREVYEKLTELGYSAKVVVT